MATNFAMPSPRHLRYGLGRLLLCIAAFIWAVPMIWVLAMSLKPNAVLTHSTAGLLPEPFTLANFTHIVNTAQASGWFLNSVGVAFFMTLITLVISALGGYALARVPFKGARIVFIVILAGLTVPEQAIFIPLDQLFAGWHMNNTIVALFIPRLAVPFGVFLMMQFFRAVPRELEEAAVLDNAGHIKIFLRVMLPLARPALTTLGIFTFLYAWNDYLWPLVSATQTPHYTITTGLASLQGNFAQSEGLGFLMATSVFASAPVLIVYIIFQRYIVSGIAMTSGK